MKCRSSTYFIHKLENGRERNKERKEKQGRRCTIKKEERGKDRIMAEPPPIGKDVVPRGFLARFLLDNINVIE